jgi:hypothetical protein
MIAMAIYFTMPRTLLPLASKGGEKVPLPNFLGKHAHNSSTLRTTLVMV